MCYFFLRGNYTAWIRKSQNLFGDVAEYAYLCSDKQILIVLNMLGFNFKRVPVTGEQAKSLQAKMKRIMHNTLNEEDRMEIEQRKRYLQSKKQYDVIWED